MSSSALRSGAAHAAGAVHERREPAPAAFTIGQVLGRLTDDFPELSPSKLRFLEDRGLIHPARTASGYRMFSGDDVDRITLVLSMQRDHYLPLKVIRQYLAELDAGQQPAWPGTSPQGPSLFGGAKHLTRDELLADTEASSALLDDAVAMGLMPATDRYDDEAVQTMRALADLRTAGIEPRHLRAMRVAVERETDLVVSALLPMRHRPDAASRTRADQRAQELVARIDTVRQALVRQSLAKRTA